MKTLEQIQSDVCPEGGEPGHIPLLEMGVKIGVLHSGLMKREHVYVVGDMIILLARYAGARGVLLPFGRHAIEVETAEEFDIGTGIMGAFGDLCREELDEGQTKRTTTECLASFLVYLEKYIKEFFPATNILEMGYEAWIRCRSSQS